MAHTPGRKKEGTALEHLADLALARQVTRRKRVSAVKADDEGVGAPERVCREEVWGIVLHGQALVEQDDASGPVQKILAVPAGGDDRANSTRRRAGYNHLCAKESVDADMMDHAKLTDVAHVDDTVETQAGPARDDICASGQE